MDQRTVRYAVVCALFAALIVVGSYLSIPIGPVPIVLQNLFVLLAGLVLGPWLGAASVGLFLLAGAVGLPVFAGGTGGLAHLVGPTGGYLFGYLVAVVLVGLIAGRRGDLVRMVIAVVAGSLVIYLLGVPWLKVSLGMDWGKAIAAGMLPFLIGDALKAAAAVAIARALRPLLISQGFIESA